MIEAIHREHQALALLRRDIHAHPELAFQETRTSDLVALKLAGWGIEVHRGFGGTGVVGVVRAGTSTKSIGLRADMDALPLQEHNQFGHRSVYDGRMHACGHDGHTAMLLGAAQYLARHRNFDGTVNLIFQPAEEAGNCGAGAMMKDGLLERHPCDAMFAMHNMPDIPAGHLAFRTGPSLASSNFFDIVVTGRGGHAAMPQNTIDPIIVASSIVQALQTLVTRNKDPLDMAVLSVTQFHAGDAYNAIPNEATIRGTVRTYRSEVIDLIESGMRRLAGNIAAAYGASAEVLFVRSYPPLVNWEEPTAFATQVAVSLLGEDRVIRNAQPLAASEDFAFFLQKVPGCYLLIGNGGGEHRAGSHAGPCELHNPSYDFNDELLPIGASYWVKLVEAYLPA